MTMPPEPDAPGPGQYNLVNYEGELPQFAASSMFVSTTNRWNFKRNNSAPGPGMFLLSVEVFSYKRLIIVLFLHVSIY